MHASHRLRIGRYSMPGQIYLVTAVCKHRRAIFHDFAAARAVVHSLHEMNHAAETLAYVVMPDHLHWLMQLGDQLDLSATVQAVKSRTTSRIRQQVGTSIDVWQKGFHDRQLRKEDDLVDMARYVVANPLRAGLVNSVREYSFWDAVWL
ncbi:REP element-mobilizing transposase RayT [Marinobacterium halophilum]|uniref:REP element-mobilizing transposase RayT n=1 Tax=Marinobacterium halophilum TaxID=267374 RepID=A0A2P8F2A3_9GAMM|nr:transposase [Marinobacterium halophilum]PSL15841.1 REP element-mobilizing transposase RayT [Marinobacterium halophilum]